MPDAEEIIVVENLSKSYHIWSSPLARLQVPIFLWMARWPLGRGWRQSLENRAARLYRDFFALDGVSFQVTRGESVGIIGRNGSGKSTLLQIITGTLQPTAGQAVIRGRVAALLELGSGFNPEFTGRENVRLNAALHGLTPVQIDERIDAMLAFADIGEFVDEAVKTYSSGMMLRLAFAVIAHIDADILIIDEALAVGDVFFVQKCMTFLHRFQQTGVLLLVSHSADAITALCQKAIWLDGGHLKHIGAPKAVTEAYLEAFFEADAQNKTGVSGKNAGTVGTSALNGIDQQGDRPSPIVRRDQREAFLNHSQYRNDLKVFEFDSLQSSFGLRGGQIVDVTLTDHHGQPYAWVVGGEVVTLQVSLEALEALPHPIIGFYVKNSLGQQLFGDNTFLSTLNKDILVQRGARFRARFVFQMPVLPPGDYTITVGLANGTQVDHVIHHWMHDALAFRSTASRLRAGGLVGLPMLEICLDQSTAVLPADHMGTRQVDQPAHV